MLFCSGFGVEAVYLLLYRPGRRYTLFFFVLWLSDTNTDSIWLELMEILERLQKDLDYFY